MVISVCLRLVCWMFLMRSCCVVWIVRLRCCGLCCCMIGSLVILICCLVIVVSWICSVCVCCLW